MNKVNKPEQNRGQRYRYVEEGMKSYHQNRGRYINLYPSGTNQFNDFERGWTQALKRSPDHLVRRYKAERFNRINEEC